METTVVDVAWSDHIELDLILEKSLEILMETLDREASFRSRLIKLIHHAMTQSKTVEPKEIFDLS